MKKVIILVVVFSIISGGCYFLYKNNVKEEPIKKTKTVENLNGVDTTLVNFISENEIRRLLAIKKYPSNFTFSNAMFDNDLLFWALDKTCLPLRECVSVSTGELDNEFERVFNLKNVSYSDYNCKADNQILYAYNKENKTYEYASPTDGVDAGNWHNHDKTYNYIEPIYTKIDNFEKIGKDYILSLYELYYDLKDNSFISADPTGSVKIFEPADYIANSSINTSHIIMDYEIGFEENKKDYPLYKYTFRKNGDNFYLYKYEH